MKYKLMNSGANAIFHKKDRDRLQAARQAVNSTRTGRSAPRALLLALAVTLFCQTVGADDLLSTSVSISPSTINSRATLVLSSQPMSEIPRKGSIEIVFPPELSHTTIVRNSTCFMKMPPYELTVSCKMTRRRDKRILVTATDFSIPIKPYAFFTVEMPDVMTQRTTTPTSSFEFKTFDEEKVLLDIQTKYIALQLKNYNRLRQVMLSSSSPEVAARNQKLTVRIVTREKLMATDEITIKLPKWNPLSWRTRSILEQKDPVCTFSNKEEIYCKVVERTRTHDTVRLYKPFKRSIEAGETIQFNIGAIINPISGKPQGGYVVTTHDNKGGKIAEGSGTLTVHRETESPSVKLKASNTTINNETSVYFEVKSPVPLEKGCKVYIYAPKVYRFGADLQEIKVGGFLKHKKVRFHVHADRNQIEVYDVCDEYRSEFQKSYAYFNISKLINPHYVMKSPESFRVEFRTAEDNPIFVATDGLTYNTSPGLIKDDLWPVSFLTVDTLTSIRFTVQPLHHSMSKDVKLTIEMPPEDFPELPANCLLEDLNRVIDETQIQCEIKDNMITFSRFLVEPWEYKENLFIEIGVKNIMMPSSSRPTGTYSVSFYDKVDGDYVLVDRSSFEDKIRAKPGEFVSVNIIPVNNQTYFIDTYRLHFEIMHQISSNGKIHIQFPESIQLLQEAACTDAQADFFSKNRKCHFDQTQNSILIEDPEMGKIPTTWFSTTRGENKRSVKISIEGIRSQRASRPSETFRFETTDANNYTIDLSTKFFMHAPPVKVSIDAANLKQTGVVVGESTPVEFTMWSPVPLVSGDLLYLKVPEPIGKSLPMTFQNCTGSEKGPYALAVELHCILYQMDSIKLTVKTKAVDIRGASEGRISQEVRSKVVGRRLFDQDERDDIIPANNLIRFTVNTLSNAESTAPTGTFQVTITDSHGYPVIQSTDDYSLLPNFHLKAEDPADLNFARVEQESQLAYEVTTFEFHIVTKHMLPKNATVDISWPQQIGVKTAGFSCFASSNRGFTKCVVDPELRTVRIFNVTSTELPGGSTIYIELYGLRNSKFAAKTDNFQVTTLDPTGNYLIDRRSENLNVRLNCNWPCANCDPDTPSRCLKCDQRQVSDFQYLHGQSCMESCPENFFSQNKVCTKCTEDCLKCEGSSQKCTECRSGMYLSGNTCVKRCPETFYGDKQNRECVKCEAPCLTCDGSPSRCTSCIQGDGNEFTFYFKNQCMNGCPADVSIISGGECRPCSSSCKTCANVPSECSTCEDHLWFDIRSKDCKQSCPLKTSVPHIVKTPGALLPKVCKMCDESCKFCHRKDPKVCTKCRAGFMLDEATRKCVDKCPKATHEVFVSITNDTLCAACDPGCSDCQYSRDHCTACKESHVFYQFQCLKQCPIGFMITPESGRTCVYARTPCAHGREFNPTLGKCTLKIPHCKEGYILNSKLDLCIPLPGFHMPFIFLYAALIWTGLVLNKTSRENFERETVVSQLLVGYTCLQTITYFLLWFLSWPMGYEFVITFHLIGILVVLILNITAIVCVLLLVEDRPFLHWRDEHTTPSNIILTLTALFSFKSLRLYHCELFQRRYFTGAFSDKYRTLIRPIFIISMVSLLQSIPVMFIDCYTIYQLKWGYEIKTMSIENLVLCVVITSLEIYEWVLYSRQQPVFMGVKDFIEGKVKDERKKSKKGQKTLSQRTPVNGGFEEERQVLSPYKSREAGRRNSTGVRVESNIMNTQNSEQMDVLNDLVKRMAQSSQIRELNQDMKVLTEVEQETKAEMEMKNALNISVREKKKMLKEKRQKFEKFRSGMTKLEEELDKAPDISVDLDPSLKAQKAAIEKVAAETREIWDAVALTDDEGMGKIRKTNPFYRQRMPLKYSHLDYYEARSDDEKGRDEFEYDKFLFHTKEALESRKRKGDMGPNFRPTQSYDNDLAREMYDENEMAVCSSFHSELSWISYPPTGKGYWEENLAEQAKFSLFAEKIKSKFNYANCISEVAPIIPIPPRDLKKTKRTQTMGAQQDEDYDPFCEEASCDSEEVSLEEALSEIDPVICEGIINQVLAGVEDSGDYVLSAIDSEGEFGSSEDSDILRRKRTKKRKREDRVVGDDLAGELSIDSFGQLAVKPDHLDMQQQKVSDKGYLVDGTGNIIDKKGNIVFARDEISDDGDIPERLRNEQRKKEHLEGQQKANLQLSKEIKQQRIDELALLDQEDALFEGQMRELQDLSMEVPSEHAEVLEDVGEKAKLDMSAGGTEMAQHSFEQPKADPAQEKSIMDYNRKQKNQKAVVSARRSIEKKSLLEKAYNSPVCKIEEEKSPKTTKKIAPRSKNLGKRVVPVQGRHSVDDDLAYVRMQSDENSPELAQPYAQTDADQVEKEKHGGTPDDSHMAGQPTQGNITDSGVETVGGQTQVEAKKYLMMYDSEASNNKPQEPSIQNSQGGAMTVGARELQSDFDMGRMSDANASAPEGQKDLTNAVGLEFMRDSLPVELQEKKKFDKFKYGYMFDLQKPQTPRQEHQTLLVSDANIPAVEQTSNIQMPKPVPFLSLMPNIAPFKAKKFREKQNQSDLRRAQVTCGSERLRYLENIYLKKKAGNQRLQNQTVLHHQGMMPHQSSLANNQPPQYSMSSAQQQYQTRHYVRNNSSMTRPFKSVEKPKGKKLNRLKKQNFIEDGMNIVTIKPAINSHAQSYMLEQSSHTMNNQQMERSELESDTLAGHIAVNVKKELNSKQPQSSAYNELDKFLGQNPHQQHQSMHPQPFQSNNTLANSLMQGGNNSMVSSIALQSEETPARQNLRQQTQRLTQQPSSNLVNDMHSAFNALRPLDSDVQASDDNMSPQKKGK